MNTQSATQPLSCIPCARRKVKCDRQQPSCSHCKRRRQDPCEYPVLSGSVRSARPVDTILKQQQERIEKLEQYILQSSGNSGRSQETLEDIVGSTRSENPHETSDSDHVTTRQGTKRDYDGRPRVDEGTQHHKQQACLVEHNKQTTYIETPMWYSWSDAKRPDLESTSQDDGTSHATQHQTEPMPGYLTTILDSPDPPRDSSLLLSTPSAKQSRALWDVYRTNVHPVVKIFFAWEKEPLMQQAATDLIGLTHGQKALVAGIYFIAVLSMSTEQCSATWDAIPQSKLLDAYQTTVENELRAAHYAATSDILVIQAFILYLLAIRNRANPATFHALMGIAVRLAQRLGLHRDGSLLKLPVAQVEERRRIWWHLQHMEVLAGQLTGIVSMTLYAEWDVKLPANIEDDDIGPTSEILPPDRRGLTSMSQCLWRYHVLSLYRAKRDPKQGAVWVTTNNVSVADQESGLDTIRQQLSERFLQHCEPLNPLHVYVQIGIHNFLLAAQRFMRQPAFSGARISEMSHTDREEFLGICMKCMDYYLLSETTPSLAPFSWHNENYFQWTAFVYVLIEAYHRAATTEAQTLWTVIDKVCRLHPRITTAPGCPEIAAIGRLVVQAWRRRQEHNQERQGQVDQTLEKPWCVKELERVLGMTSNSLSVDHDSSVEIEHNPVLDFDFDFDLIDWSFWETERCLQPVQD